MSTLTTIQSTDLITNSRADINGNFSALNADKMETSVLDTDTTLAANSDSKVATQKAVKAYIASFLNPINLVYPVGSIYLSVVSTNPGTLFGAGTWVAWGSGRVPVGLDAGQTEFDTVEETGGAKTHTLTTDEIPAHTHPYGGTVKVNGGSASGWSASGSSKYDNTDTQANTGGDGAHNNLQPYIVCYMWKRTA
ncbi:MAG: hypothetical protein IPO40_24620 [Fibrobacteres bacterium]|nr:hypothetical protein [Fibrobacterota bacterium]